MFDQFWGNAFVANALQRMVAGNRIAQTILLSGPEGVGKATLVRRFAAQVLGSGEKIEKDDLSREENRTLIAERERWTSEKRADDALFFNTHPDFLTFCPEGPLRQISIQQMRLARERSQMLPLRGRWRVFLIDQIDRANPQAADSLLKTLEEPPAHLILFLTAENPFDLASTIRSRSVQFHLTPLSDEDMRTFAKNSAISDLEKRIALAGGCPGTLVTMDLTTYEKRRGAMMALLDAASGGSFANWARKSEPLLASKTERLDLYFRILYGLIEDILIVLHGGHKIRNADIAAEIREIASRVNFDWLHSAVRHTDELLKLQRRNVQKGPSLDQMVIGLNQA